MIRIKGRTFEEQTLQSGPFKRRFDGHVSGGRTSPESADKHSEIDNVILQLVASLRVALCLK